MFDATIIVSMYVYYTVCCHHYQLVLPPANPVSATMSIGTLPCDPWIRNENVNWWVEDAVGPLPLEELLCESCGDFLVCVYAEELWTERAIHLCNFCGAFLLLGHNRHWSIGEFYWT